MRIIRKKKIKETKIVIEEYQSPAEIDQEVRGWSEGQAQFAIKIGMSPDMLSKILKGERRLTEDKYKKMLKLLTQAA